MCAGRKIPADLPPARAAAIMEAFDVCEERVLSEPRESRHPRPVKRLDPPDPPSVPGDAAESRIVAPRDSGRPDLPPRLRSARGPRPAWSPPGDMVLARLAASLAWLGRLPRGARAVAAGLVAVLLLFALVSKWTYSRTLGGFEGYALPRHPIAYGPEARDVKLTASDRTLLRAKYLGRAPGERPAGKAILIVPGWLSTKESFGVATMAQWLHPEFDVLVLDPRGQGGSRGQQHPAGSARFDVLAGLAFLKAQGNVSVGLFAEREGAYAAVLAAGEGAPPASRLFDSVFLASPVAHWGEPSLGGGFWRDPMNPLGRLTWRVAADVRLAGGEAQPLAEVLPRLAGTPVMLSGAMEDPEGIVRQLYLVTPEPRSLRLLPGAGKPVAWRSYHRYYEAVRQFFGMTLANPVMPTEAEPQPVPPLR